MSTHYFNRIPTNNKWYVHDGYYLKQNLTVDMLKKIFDTGHTHVYISTGKLYADKQVEYQKNLKDIDLEKIKDIKFNYVIIDSLNPCDISIKDILKSKYYVMGREKIPLFNSYYTWKEGDFLPPKDIEYKSFIECKFDFCRNYYQNQIENKITKKNIISRKLGKYM